MPNTLAFTASIIAETLVSKIKGKTMGVLGEHLPKFDTAVLIEELRRRNNAPIRLAILGTKSKLVTSNDTVEVTYSVTEANKWRNDIEAKKGKRLFIVVLGVVPKLPSLRSVLVSVTDQDLRPILRDRAISWLNTGERRSFWGFLYKYDDLFTTGSLLEYAATAEEIATRSNKYDIPDFEYRNVWMLGMIPHRKLVDNDGEKKVEKIARPNLTMVARLRSLSKQDLRTITKVIESDTTPDSERDAAREMLAYSQNRTCQRLKELDYEQVMAVLSPKKKQSKTATLDGADQPAPAPKEKMWGDEAVIEDLIKNNGENIKAIADMYSSDNDEDDVSREEVTIDGRMVVRKTRVGTSQISSAVNRLITETRFGGIVYVETANDYVECLKLMESGESNSIIEFLPLNIDDRYAISSIIDRVVKLYAESIDKDVLAAWTMYLNARAEILEYKHDLVDHPLLAMISDPALLEACDILVKAYGEMMNSMANLRDIIRGKHSDTAKRLMSKALALDVIFLRYGGGSAAVAGPTHPFHLWRWVQIARLLIAHREEFKTLGDDLIMRHAINPPVSSPHILLNAFVEEIPKDYVFIGIGSISSLPLYGDPESRTAAKFRADEIGDIAKRFVNMSPYAKFGFEVVVIDPPSIADITESLVGINRDRFRSDLIPVHLRIFRTRDILSSTDEEDVEIEELATIVRENKGSIEIEPNRLTLDQIQDRMKDRTAHYTLIFEPGDAQTFRVGIDVSPTLSPLIIPRHYSYDQLEDQFDVIIHGDATPFGSYYSLFRELLNLPEGNTIGRRSGASRWIPSISKVGEQSMWFSIVDQGIEPTLKIPNAIRLDKRNSGGRDLHTFTSHPDTVRHYVEKIVKIGELIPDPHTVERAFNLMQHLGGDTIPIAVSTASSNGQIIYQQARGLLGVMAVAAWHLQEAPDSLVLSLDTELSRRWILGHVEDSGRRGDLLSLRQANDGLHLDVIEVKARDDEKAFVKIKEGSKNRTVVEGSAIDQIDNTIAILKRILPKDGTSGVDKARREILRDQLYMSVANRALTPNRRERAVRMLDQFFDNGADRISGRLFIVHIESNQRSIYPSTPKVRGLSHLGNEIEVYNIIESEVTKSELEDLVSVGGERSEEVLISRIISGKKKDEVIEKAAQKKTEVKKAVSADTVDAGKGSISSPEATSFATQKLRDSIEILIGKDPTGKDVTWNTAINPNFGILTTGDTGSGKTQIIRAIMHDLRKAGYPVLVFDFKNDYSDRKFADSLNLSVYDVVQSGLPFNPLSLMANEQGIVQPIRQCHDFAAIIARVEGLKEQQTHRLVEAQRRAYENHGLDPRAKINIDKIKSEPVFDEVLDLLRQDDDEVSNTVIYRLQKFSDLELFPTGPTDVTFEDLVKDGIVLTLNDTSNDKLMQILAEIMIVKLHAIIKRGTQPRVLRRMLVFDEAWRIAKSQRLVELAREGRAFGVGMLIGTQNPKDMPENLVSCLRTQIYLYNKDADNQKVIVRALCNTTSGPVALQFYKTLANLGQFQGYLISEQYKEGIRVNVIPHKDRN